MITIDPSSQLTERELAHWHPTKNGDVNPLTVTRGSGAKNYWWHIKACGHDYESTPKDKSKSAGCKICNSRGSVPGQKSVATDYPEVAARWHPTLNGSKTPEDYAPTSHKKAYFTCPEFGHPYYAEIATQTAGGAGCNICADRVVLAGFNDLPTKYPVIGGQWHPTKNDCAANEVFSSDTKLRWWYSEECGHDWLATPIARTSRNTGCLVCAGHYVVAEINSLAATHPEIAAQLHPTKNGEVKATEITIGYDKPLNWFCKKGHDWPATPWTRLKNGCPYCSGFYAWPGESDLPTLRPALAAQWHPTKNGDLKPEQVGINSNKMVWWERLCGHEWPAAVFSRAVQGAGCLACWQQSHTSEPEKTIAQMIEDAGLEVVRNDRTLLGGNREIDVYVPSRKFGIEYNGVAWHTEAKGKNKTYHWEKYAAAAATGIQLIQIWEDDYKRNPELVMTLLRHKLGISNQPRLAARKTTAGKITAQAAKDFFTANHIQGFVQGTHYFGLHAQSGDLVAAMSVRLTGGELYINRYATSAIVSGGFGKLLAHVEWQLKPSQIKTFSDNMVSSGELYQRAGFRVGGYLKPAYQWVKWGKRHHARNFRLAFFENNPELTYDASKTLGENAILNGFEKAWDAGKVKWVKFLG